jgi:hypothetical protein
MRLKSVAFLTVVFLFPGALRANPVVELMNFSTGDPSRWEEVKDHPSQARPLSLEEIQSLSRAGVSEKSLVRMIRSRGALVSPRGDTLAALKKQGVTDRALEALSTYSLAENRKIDVLLTLDVVTPFSVENAPTLYLGLFHADVPEDLVVGPLRRVLAARWKEDDIVDDADPLLPTKIRRLKMVVPFRAVHHGKMTFRLLLSPRPGLTRLADLGPEDAPRVQTLEFDYPPVSLQSRAELDLAITRDPLIPQQFQIRNANVRTYWD